MAHARLPLERVPEGTEWFRIHSRRRDALWFGPAPGKKPVNRFDDPLGHFRVAYFGLSLEGCFAETFLRNPPVRILSLADLAERSAAVVRVRRELRLTPLHGAALARLGVTAEWTSGNDYAASRQLARSLWEHPRQPDGLIYRCRHDDGELAVAIFDRARDAFEVTGGAPLTGDPHRLAALLNRYDVGLTR
ncbi:MAG: RES domain-containing protein [Acidobacteria bacterium]|nr:RES domain-containing protein [Acidobacteriota bacterium]